MNVDVLKARGEQTDDQIVNLFKEYQVVSDSQCVRYIKTKRYQYDNGYNISTDKLMTSALNKFEILQKDNKWNSISPNQDHITALASVI